MNGSSLPKYVFHFFSVIYHAKAYSKISRLITALVLDLLILFSTFCGKINLREAFFY